jgi:hypothetical protein
MSGRRYFVHSLVAGTALSFHESLSRFDAKLKLQILYYAIFDGINPLLRNFMDSCHAERHDVQKSHSSDPLQRVVFRP